MLAILALETGQVFKGRSIGINGVKVGEVVFNTALTGYQEIITDPSYAQQIITFTNPHIGNTGINSQDSQAQKIFASGIIVKSLAKYVSNWRANLSLAEFLQQQRVVGIEDIDTRKLTTILREHGSLNGCLMAGIIDEKYAIQQAKAYSGLVNANLAIDVSTKSTYQIAAKNNVGNKHIVIIDFGVKSGIIDCLTQRGCNVTVVPAQMSVREILALKPDGILLSNGPGDPAACESIIANVKQLLLANLPILGICLGHQILALAFGAVTYKMNFGHHGGNHPVQDIRNQKVIITSQNHGFAVAEESLPEFLQVTHRSLFDQTLQGFKHRYLPIFGFQGHPEASPGPHEGGILFDEFIHCVRKQYVEEIEFA
jgi:carbamoyl-phosphate synthase small subunit